MTFDTIRSDFAFLDDWEDRYRYVIELGRGLPPLAEAYRTDSYKVRGCASQVWLAIETEGRAGGVTVFRFHGDSDAHIVRGLVESCSPSTPARRRMTSWVSTLRRSSPSSALRST